MVLLQVDKNVSPEKVGTKRTRQLSVSQIAIIRRQPSTNQKKIKCSEYGLNDCYNPLLELKYLDLHRFIDIIIIIARFMTKYLTQKHTN